ncbi:MAG TPA: diacylglycerol kinase family protein [Polyangia bacterium]|nr:diacylglycerol kinase family protein [Polyangia bacterium]
MNPRSRANRRNPHIASEFQAMLGADGRVVAAMTLDELDAATAALAKEPPGVIGVHGGDGTLHKLLTSLGRVFGERPLPPIAILGGGTMNVVAASLRIRERAIPFVRQLVETARSGGAFQTVRRRCLRIVQTGTPEGIPGSAATTSPGKAELRQRAEHLGFIFGNGLMANFLGEYYGTGKYGPARAAWLLLRACGSALIGGPFVKKLFKRFEGTLELDGQLLERTSFVGVGAATVREVGLGFKLNHRADDDPERFGFLAIHARPAAIIPDFIAVHRGKGVAPSRAMSAVASTLRVTPKGGTMSYTIDGDLYRSDGPLAISMGPPILFVRPAGALIVAPRGDTMAGTP